MKRAILEGVVSFMRCMSYLHAYFNMCTDHSGNFLIFLECKSLIYATLSLEIWQFEHNPK